MGKSPGKWIKAILFGKKASKSNVLKRRANPKSSYEKTLLAPSEDPAHSSPVESLSISAPTPVPVDGEIEKENLDSGNVEVAGESADESNLASLKQDADAKIATDHSFSNDHERMRLEQAATKAQATFRGYLARRAFRTLKGIIRLQAVIRGHLVRRQAVATLYCVVGIVKFQSFVRGQMARRSDLGRQVQGQQSLSRRDAGLSESCTINSCQREKLFKNAFVHQLLTSSPTAMTLRLQYDPEQPNSAWNWLLRWTKSCIWGSLSEREKIIDSNTQVETKKAGTKHSGPKKPPANVEKASAHPASESEKLKRNSRKASYQQVKSGQHQARNASEKGKNHLKKNSNSTSEISVQAEIESEKPKHTLRKSSNPPVSELSGHKTQIPSNKSLKVLEEAVPNLANEAKFMMQPMEDDPVNDLEGGRPASGIHDKQSSIRNDPIPQIDRGFNSKEDQLSNENHKISKRRASLPAKHDNQEPGQRETRVPSYMAATESAKAKARGQVSSSFSQDVSEKDSLTRRHSLPSSVNGKPSSSPRVQRLIQASGKGGTRIDRSLSSSRDSSDKVVQAEWRR